MTTALERVVSFAHQAHLTSAIPEYLMPDGWMAWEVPEEESRLELAFGFNPTGVPEPHLGGMDRGDGVRHVRTEAGVLLYKAPIGTPITDRMREAAQKMHGRGTESSQFDAEGKFEQAEAQGQKKALAAAKKPVGSVPVASDAKGTAEGAGAGAKGAAQQAPAHPADVSGHKVQKVYSHPQTKKSLYDLGNGLHAEGEAGKKPGPVMRSPTGLVPEQLSEKGWQQFKPKPGFSHPGAVPKRGMDWACLKPPCAPGSRLRVNTDHTVTKRGSGGGAIIGHIGEHGKGGWTFRHAATGTASKAYGKSPEEAAHHLAEYHNAKALAEEHGSKPFVRAKYEAAANQIAKGDRGGAASSVAEALQQGTSSSARAQAEQLRDSLLSSEVPKGHIPVPENMHGQSAPETEAEVKDLLRRTDVDEGVQRHVQEQIDKLKQEMDQERSRDSKAKLAFHSAVLVAGVALMVLLAHAGLGAVPSAAIGGALPFGLEFVDKWKRFV